jgi:hypothetical protein
MGNTLTLKQSEPYGEVCIGVLGGGAYNFVRWPVFVMAGVLEAALRVSSAERVRLISVRQVGEGKANRGKCAKLDRTCFWR